MACKLYYEHAGTHWPLGTFRNREKAKAFWQLVKEKLWNELGVTKPIYVETGKGRGK